MSDKCYGLIAEYIAGNYGAARVRWEVCWRMSLKEITEVKEVCETEAKCFYDEIGELAKSVKNALELDSSYRRTSVTKRRRPDRQQIEKKERSFREQMTLLSAKEAEINGRYAREMFDPMFPTTTSVTDTRNFARRRGAQTVAYSILTFEEDPKDVGRGDLLMLRAKLHAYGGDDVSNDDETNDDEIATIGQADQLVSDYEDE